MKGTGSGRSARDYGDELEVLRGRLSDEPGAVRPDNYCLECIQQGLPQGFERCFHIHWLTPERGHHRETR